MPKKNLLIAVIVSVLLSLALVGTTVWYGSRPLKKGGDFVLNFRDQDWQLSLHTKKLNLIYVGYVKCPDVCPLSLSFSAQAFRRLSAEELKDVQLIFISVDYKHDTAADVADYAAQFFPDFIGLTGTKQQIDSTIQSIGASYITEENPKSYLGYSISHTDRIFFLDKKGYVIETISNLRSEEVLTKKIQEIL